MSEITTASGLEVKIYEHEPLLSLAELHKGFTDRDLLLCQPTDEKGKVIVLALFQRQDKWVNARYIEEILDEMPEWRDRPLVVESKRTIEYRERRRRMVEKYLNLDEDVDYMPTTTKEQIQYWLDHTKFVDFLDYVTNHVMGQEQVKLIAANVYNYLFCIAEGKRHNNNIILAAPSGCGKTETFRTLKAYFAEKIPLLPVLQVDLTSITEEGFKGKNTQDLVEGLFAAKRPDGIGIIFMDEFDKKLLPSYSSGGSNVNAAVQAQLLTLIEGREITKANNGPTIDTNNTMFLGLGAFDMCRTSREETRSHSLGFGTRDEEDDLTSEELHYQDITREDMIKVGASYEFLGRFASVINYHELTRDAMERIIDMLRRRTEEAFGCSIELGPDMLEALCEKANGRYGCRMLGSLIHDTAMHGYLKMLMEGGAPECYTIYLEEPEKASLKKMDEPSLAL